MRFFVSFWIKLNVLGIIILRIESTESTDQVQPSSLQQANHRRGIYSNFGTLHSFEKFSYWVVKEETVYDTLRNYLNHLKFIRNEILRYQQDYKESSKKALANSILNLGEGEIIGSSAVLSHRMINRYTLIVDPLRKFINSDSFRKTAENVSTVLNINPIDIFLPTYNEWPNAQDLYMTQLAIFKIHEVHGFHAKSMANSYGSMIETSHIEKVTSRHCRDLGIRALQNGLYSIAIEWLEFGQKLISTEKDDFARKQILDEAIKVHNNVLQRDGVISEDDRANVFLDFTYAGESHENRISARDASYNHYAGTVGNGTNTDYENYLGLCNGQNFQPKHVQARLKCYLEKTLHPYLIINPVKTEQLSDFPLILQMYDVLSNEMIQDLYEIRGEMQLSTVTVITDLRETLTYRTSAGSLIRNRQFERKLNQISERLTGFKIDTRIDEPIQVVEYTPGRFCIYHNDTNEEYKGLSKTDREQGFRLASILYYIERPTAGGATSFCNVGIAADGIKGSAVFWVNLFKNGSVRADVVHAGCVIVEGKKIVLNRWIRYNPNFQLFKCSLNQLE